MLLWSETFNTKQQNCSNPIIYIYLHTKHEAWESPLKNATTWYKYYVPPIFHQVKTDEEDPTTRLLVHTILLLSFICMTSFPFLNSKPVWTVPKFYSSLSSKAIMDLIEVIHDCVAPCVAPLPPHCAHLPPKSGQLRLQRLRDNDEWMLRYWRF